MADFPQFEANIKFLQFLKRVNDEPELLEALKRTDFSAIYNAAGLSEREREFLKMVNWNEMEIRVDPAMQPIATEGGEICERRVSGGWVERGCWRN